MTDAELKEIEAWYDAATKGEWISTGYGTLEIHYAEGGKAGITYCGRGGLWVNQDILNSQFIAKAHADILRLLAEVRALREEADEKERLFELQQQRMMQAVEAWREEMKNKIGDPEYRESIDTTIPDLGALLLWLLDERKEAKAEVDRLRKLLEKGGGA